MGRRNVTQYDPSCEKLNEEFPILDFYKAMDLLKVDERLRDNRNNN